MSLFQTIKNLDKKFSWSFWGFVLAVLFGALTVHDRFIADKHPQFYLDVLTNTAVLDIKEDLPKLDILYDNIDIRKRQMSLSILSVRVINDSTQDVLKTHYDPDDPFGMKINEGRIIKAELTTVTNEYLKKNLSITAVSNNTLLFKPVIMEAGNFFIIKLLVLHPAKSSLSIQDVGHVAGMNAIPTRDIYKDVNKESLISSTFKGSWQIQLIRLPSYFVLSVIAIIVFMILVVLPITSLKEKYDKRRRSTTVNEFRTSIKATYTEKDEYILNFYKSHGVELLSSVYTLLSDKSQLDIHCKQYAKKKASPEQARAELYLHNDVHKLSRELDMMAFLVPPSIFHELVDNEIIIKQDESCVVDENCLKNLNHFIKFLRSRNLFPEPKVKNSSLIAEKPMTEKDAQ